MKWGKKLDKYAQKSSCGRYSVCAIGFDTGRAGFFEAWRTRAHAEGPHLISTNLKTADQARRMCEADAND